MSIISTYNELFIETISGDVLVVKKLGLGKRRDFAKRIDSLIEILINASEDQQGLSFEEFFDVNLTFSRLCQQALYIAGVTTSDLTIDDIYSLLIDDGTGRGIIEQFNFKSRPVVGEDGEVKSTKDNQSWEQLLAQIWQLEGSIKSTLDVIYDDRLPGDEMIEVIKFYIELLTPPEERQKKKLKDLAKTTINKIREQHKNKPMIQGAEEVEFTRTK